ncbi:MAG: transglutaminase domain-containing protein [Candidatus Thermoplasmatota archaeon]|nr:transglutaminase domain-containing protein [Candidatus Thermoplasmatota archaeon]
MKIVTSKISSKKLLALSMILFCSLSAISPPAMSAQNTDNHIKTIFSDNGETGVYLLRVEHYLVINASEDVGVFHIRYSFPPDYAYQVPILLELHNDSSLSALLQYDIENDTLLPNKIVNFTVGPMKKDESRLLHFSCWVLVKNHDFSDLPTYVKIPKKYQLPEETKIWLASTEQVQLHSILIRLKARQLQGSSDNLVRYAGRIAPFIKYHRHLFFVFALNTGLFFSQDARTTLLINGENVGRSHLACAFFRVHHIPARVILVNNDQGFWTQMHYMVEYYCPGYGWVLVETTGGKSPYATHHQVVNRVCYPQDEEDTKRDYIFPFMKGEERWFWIDNEDVDPYYVDCTIGSKSQMFTETNFSADQMVASYAFVLTQIIFRYYQGYLGMNLTGQNRVHFENATMYQKQAILSLKQNKNLDEYLTFLNLAYTEYQKIDVDYTL